MKPNLPQEPPSPRSGDREPERETCYADWQGIQPLTPDDTKRNFFREQHLQHRILMSRNLGYGNEDPLFMEMFTKGLMRHFRRIAIETGVLEGLFNIAPESVASLVEHGFHAEHVRAQDVDVDPSHVIDILLAHHEAHKLILEFCAEPRPITKHAIRELHALITSHQATHDAVDSLGQQGSRKMEPGTFRTFEAYSNTPQSVGAIHSYAPFEQIDPQLDCLLELYEEYRTTCHPLLVGAWLHHRFMQIHPFPDGNGRTGRMLLNWHLYATKWFPVSVRLKDRGGYLDAMQQADDGDLSALVDFLTAMIKKSARTLLHYFPIEERQRVLGPGE